MALIITIVGAFLKDAITKAWTSSRRWFSSSRQQRKRDRAEYREFLIEHHDAFIEELHFCLLGWVQLGIMVGFIIMLWGIASGVLTGTSQSAFSKSPIPDRVLWVFQGFFIFTFLFNLYVYFPRYWTLLRIRRVLRKKRNLRWQP